MANAILAAPPLSTASLRSASLSCSIHSQPTMPTARYSVVFGSAAIDTTVTSDAAAADEWVRRVRAAGGGGGGGLLLGLDCEWKPCDHLWPPVAPRVAVLQLCAGDSCLVLQLLHVGGRVPPLVRGLLANPSVRFVGIGVGEDVAKLADGYGMSCAAPVDLEDICNRRLGTTRRLGLKGYVRELLGLTMEKPMDVTRSDWEKPELDAAQVRHACIDAYVSYKLGERVLITN